MADSQYLDEIPSDFFNILDDFPLEGIEVGSDDWDSMQLLDLPTNMQFPGLFGELQNDLTKDTKNISVAYDETCRQNQFPSSAETTSSGGALLSDDSSDAKPTHFFKTSSPVSILESTGSFFAEKPKTASAGGIPAKRARTKRSRSRPSTFDRLRALPRSWSTTKTSYPSISEPAKRTFLTKKKKKKKKKNETMKKDYWPEFSREAIRNPSPVVGKKCTHCEVTSTPQWREGPMGPKTLCNACGVRYRSGRLFPEYRPAASPTFIPAVHSNSHKKVVEMRNKASTSSSNNNNNNNSNRVGLKLYYRSQPSLGNHLCC